MTASKALQFFLLISFMIFSTCTENPNLGVILTNGLCKTDDLCKRSIWNFPDGKCNTYSTIIEDGVDKGNRHYVRRDGWTTFEPPLGITKIIVYIDDKSIMDKILHDDNFNERLKLAEDLRGCEYQLLYLSVDGIEKTYERVIAEFIRHVIGHRDGAVSSDRHAIDINGIEIIQGEKLEPKYSFKTKTNHIFSEFKKKALKFNLVQQIRKMGSVGNQEGLKEKSVMWIQKFGALGLPKQNRG